MIFIKKNYKPPQIKIVNSIGLPSPFLSLSLERDDSF